MIIISSPKFQRNCTCTVYVCHVITFMQILKHTLRYSLIWKNSHSCILAPTEEINTQANWIGLLRANTNLFFQNLTV